MCECKYSDVRIVWSFQFIDEPTPFICRAAAAQMLNKVNDSSFELECE